MRTLCGVLVAIVVAIVPACGSAPASFRPQSNEGERVLPTIDPTDNPNEWRACKDLTRLTDYIDFHDHTEEGLTQRVGNAVTYAGYSTYAELRAAGQKLGDAWRSRSAPAFRTALEDFHFTCEDLFPFAPN